LKKEIGVLMLCGALLLSGCGSEDLPPGIYTQGTEEVIHDQVITQPEQETNGNITWASENNEVKVTPVKVAEYWYKGVTVEVNNVKKEFDWEFSSMDDPRVFYTDVTGDGKEEAVIILNKGKGTGLSIDELHVLNSEDLSEIKVRNFEDIVADQIETHVAKNDDDTLAIKVKTQGKEHDFIFDYDPSPNYNQDELAFGGVVYYELENQKIISRIGASVGISPTYVCDFHIIYKFDNEKNEFIVDQIEFVPNDK
jgi:ferredoxin-fold anticodon binding domain-containing protein